VKTPVVKAPVLKTRVAKAGRWRLWITGTLALVLILMASLVGCASLMFPWMLSHPEKVQSFLADRLKRPVAFAKLSGEWRPEGPLFSLDGLRIGGENGSEVLTIERAELAFDFYAFLHKGRSWHELRIVAPVIDLEHGVDGQWQVRQWQGAQNTGKSFDLGALRSLGSVGLRGARINISDAGSGRKLHLVDVELRISERLSGREVFARFRTESGTVPMQLACDLDSGFASGRCYVRGRGLLADEWLATWPIQGVAAVGGRIDVDAWIDLEKFGPRRAQLELSAADVIWRGQRLVQLSNGQTVEPRFSPDRMQLALLWERLAEGGWRLALTEGDIEDESAADQLSRLEVQRIANAQGAATRVMVQSLRLERVLPWLALSDTVSPVVAGMLFEAAPQGELHDLVWQRGGDGVAQLSGSFRNIGLHATRKLPRVQGLSGRLSGDERATLVHLDAVHTDFSYPGVFRQALPVQLDPLLIALMPQPDGLRIGFEQLHVRGEGFEVEGHMALEFTDGGGRPFIDGVVRVLPGSVPAAKAVWPVNVMPAVTVQWLDRALESGQIESGMAAIRGDLDDWPFAGKEGRFDAIATISETQVKFHRLWPHALLHSARAQFVNNAMQIDIASAEILGSPIHDASARIDNMKAPLLTIDARSLSEGSKLLSLIRESPLQQKFGAELLGVSIDGATDVDLNLQLPLMKDGGPAQVQGRVMLRDADLRDLKWNLRFDKASGGIRFNQTGFSADALNVRLQEDVAELNIAVGGFVADEAHQLEASLRGELPIAAVMSGFDALEPHYAKFPGKTHWDLTLIVDKADTNGLSRKHLAVRSDLLGMAVNLPAPLRKDAGTAMPFEFAMSLPVAGSRISMKLGQLARFEAIAESAELPFSAHLALGGGLADALPERGMRIDGEAPAIDLGGWAGMDSAGDGSSFPLDVDVHAEEVDVLGRAFADTSVRIERSDTRSLVTLKGDGIDGGFEMATVNSDLLGITARFKTLHWPEAKPSSPSHPLDPSLVPPLHIWVGDLRLGTAAFGEARIETRPSDTGMRIEEITARSPTLTMRASGSWELKPSGEESALDITFSAEDIGRMLNGLGYGSVIEGGQTVARLNGTWSGSPAQFGLHRVRGTLAGEVGEGRILDVEPGAGRLFGLVNFASIPRRLSLDFSDFFQSGMAFDSVKGSFSLHEGDAVTQDLKVEAPSAEIKIKGRAGLVARDYDQEMEVVPRVRSALPLVGVLAGGPVGAVVGVLAQDVLRKPLDGIVTARYRVQGSWEKPDVVLIAKEKRLIEPAPAQD
jgi:uncharacterized protein (TIGR02099 family)